MSYNIDIIIILSFLAINLIAGFYSGRGIKNIKDMLLVIGISAQQLLLLQL